jgi:hypothetical protein
LDSWTFLSRLNYGVLSNVIAARASDKAEQKGGERISVNLAMRVAATSTGRDRKTLDPNLSLQVWASVGRQL